MLEHEIFKSSDKKFFVIVLVQARMGSTRLPGKVLEEVDGKTLLEIEVSRIRRAKTVDQVVVITTEQPQDNRIAELCKVRGIDVFRGSETDLLDRHYQAAKQYRADFIVKIPSDCPLADPKLIDSVIGLWFDHPDRYDYVSNYHPPTFPDGMDVEGCSFSVLEIAWNEAKKPYEREHTFPFIWDQPDRFRIGNVENPRGNMFMTQRWTLDYPEDAAFLKAVLRAFKGKPDFDMDDVLRLLGEHPEIQAINHAYAGVNWYRNAKGQLKTVGEEQYRDEPGSR